MKLLAFALTALIAWLTAPWLIEWALAKEISAESAVAHEMFQFERRDRAVAALVLTRGSDVREAVAYNTAKRYCDGRGLNFLSRAHSSHDATVEQYQIVSALDLGKRGLVVVDVSPLDFAVGDDPIISEH